MVLEVPLTFKDRDGQKFTPENSYVETLSKLLIVGTIQVQITGVIPIDWGH